MNYRWMIIGASVTSLGLYLYLLYKIPFSWFVSLLGLLLFFFGFAVKKHDRYAEGRAPLKSTI